MADGGRASRDHQTQDTGGGQVSEEGWQRGPAQISQKNKAAGYVANLTPYVRRPCKAGTHRKNVNAVSPADIAGDGNGDGCGLAGSKASS